MPLFAKLLAVLNVLAAGGFIYLASLDYEKRQSWSYEVFRTELILEGLPVDDKDVGRRVDQALYPDDTQAAYELFEDSGAGESVRTQELEVQRLKDKTKADLDALGAAKRRERLRELYLAQTRIVQEREAVAKQFADPKNATDKLMEQFLARFDQAAAEDLPNDPDKKQAIARRRVEIAHLLYNLDRNLLAHQRLMVVIGVRAFVRESEAQALALRDMTHQLHLLTIDDRELFERNYHQQRDRALYLAYELTRKKKELEDTNTRIANTKDQIDGNAEKKIDGRKKQIEDLKALIEKTKEDTETALKTQSDLEKQLFDLNKSIGNLLDVNLKLERDIRHMELGRSRGGRP